jgi:hypothetical protein
VARPRGDGKQAARGFAGGDRTTPGSESGILRAAPPAKAEARSLRMRARPLAAALVLAAASPAQNRLDAAVDPLFRQLADPKTAAAAQAQLERFGDKILPQLRQRLAPPRYGEAEVRTSILYLLGQLGRAGLPAMREIVDTARDAGAPPGVARQAVWAIGEIGASGTADERRNWTQVLTRQCARRVDSFLVNTVWCRLHLGNTPAKGQVQQWLVEGNDDEATAAAQHLAAEPIEPADRADFVDSLRTALDGAQPRPEFPWEKRGAEAAAP